LNTLRLSANYWRSPLVKVHPSRQQEPAFSFHHPSHPSPSAEEFGPPNLVDGLVGVLHHVKLVIDDPTVWSVLLDTDVEFVEPHKSERFAIET
jgi:hypothetical protein